VACRFRTNFENFLNRNCVWWNFNRAIYEHRFPPHVVSTGFIFCCTCVGVNRYMTLDHVSRKMWLETMMLLCSLQTRFPLGWCNKSLLQHILFVSQSADARHFGSFNTLQDAFKLSPLQIFRCTDKNPMLFFTSCDVCQPGLHCTSLTSA